MLKPSGLWINFSNPFRISGDPVELGPRRLNELPEFFNEMGFDAVNFESKRFTLLNLEIICDETSNMKQLVHFFTLRKNDLNLTHKSKSVQRFFNHNSNVWREIPEIVKGRELTLAQTKSFDGQSCGNERIEIRMAGDFFSIPPDIAILLETILECVNGKNTLKELFTILQEKGIGLGEDTFLQLIYVLNVQHYLIKLSE